MSTNDRVQMQVESEQLFREALAAAEAAHGPDHPDVACQCANLAQAVALRGDLDEALALAARAVELFRSGLGVDHPTTRQAEGLLASLIEGTEPGADDEAPTGQLDHAVLLSQQGDVDQALEALDGVLASTGLVSLTEANARGLRAHLLSRRGRNAEALDELTRAIEAARQAGEGDLAQDLEGMRAALSNAAPGPGAALSNAAAGPAAAAAHISAADQALRAGNAAAAREAAASALAATDTARATPMRLKALHQAATAAVMLTDTEGAAGPLTEGLALAAALGHAQARAAFAELQRRSDLKTTERALARGDLEAAVRSAGSVLDSAEADADTADVASACNMLTQAHLAAGRPKEALDFATRARGAAERLGNPQGVAHFESLAAMCRQALSEAGTGI